MLQFWLILIILVFAVPMLIRAYGLRPGALRRWRHSPQTPLSVHESALLFHWQSRNLALFVIFCVVGFADAVLTALRLLEGSLAVIVWLLFVFLGIAGLIHHFTARCPRCGFIIGVQVNLLLPDACQRCRVALRKSPVT